MPCLSKCKPLEEYSEFVRRIRKATHGVSKDALAVISYKVISECIRDGILAEILTKERVRVMSSVLGEFNWDRYVALERSDSFDAGREIGIQQGSEAGKVKTLIELVNEGLLDISTGAKKAGMKVEAFEKLVNNLDILD